MQLQRLVQLAVHMAGNANGIYNECHAMRLLDQEAVAWIRRQEGACGNWTPLKDEQVSDAEVNATLAEIDAMLDRFQQTMGGELGHDGDPFNE